MFNFFPSIIYFLKEVFAHEHFNDPVFVADVVLDDSVNIYEVIYIYILKSSIINFFCNQTR